MFRTRQLVCSSKDLRSSNLRPSLPAPQQEEAQSQNAPPKATAPPAPSAAPTVAVGPTSQSPPDPESEKTAAERYQALMAEVQQVFDAATKGGKPDPDKLMRTVKRAYDSLKTDDSMLTETVRQRASDYTWALRAANTAILAIRLGLEINYDERRSLALGLCALLHDIGMLTIPEEVLNSRSLTPQQMKLIRNHPLESKKIVENWGEKFAWIGNVVVQVHEKYDGSGYPNSLKEDQIHEFARIIGLTDTYEAMTHPRGDRDAHVTYNVLSQIVDLRNKEHDPRLIKALIHIVSIFPLGSLVKLNNGSIGRVIQTNKLQSARPLIEILIDTQGNRMSTSQFTNLAEEPMLYIEDPGIDESVLKQRT